jgi:hypothetical protein
MTGFRIEEMMGLGLKRSTVAFDIDLVVDSMRSGGGGITISSEAETGGAGEGENFWGRGPPKDLT